MRNFLRLLADKSGASAAEYALILAIVGAAIAFAAFSLGTTIANAMNGAADLISNPQSAGGSGAPSGAAS
jgi:pilus assembly protein Flp/PilA